MQNMKTLNFEIQGKTYNLRYRGNSELLGNSELHYLGIVGSRSILKYTEEVLETLFSEYLKNYPFCIVSGGMYGVDLFSHNLALKHGLKTIVVLPCGISNYDNSILSSSLKSSKDSEVLVISQYDDFVFPKKYFFLERNRLVVSLSKTLLVAQSSMKSGSSYSGNYSLTQNKKTYCVPLSLDKPMFQGNNHLISKGARVYLDGKSILNEFGIVENLKPLSEKIADLLTKTPLTEEELLIKMKTKVNHDTLQKSLLKMILEGVLFFDGERYRL